MPKADKKARLKKELGLFDVYAIATGSTISGGFFLLPGLAASMTGPAFILAYAMAVLLLIPSVLSNIELSTAMPRAGGVYYFLDRSLGPMTGAIGGIGVWLLLILKVAFALIGISAYTLLFIPDFDMTIIAVFIAILLGVVNMLGAKKSGKVQSLLVSGLLIILMLFIGNGTLNISEENLSGVFEIEFSSFFATTGLVFISYIGVTKVASLSEEIKNPERNIPLSIFYSLGTAFIIYLLGTVVMVGVLPLEKITGNLTVPATVAKYISGEVGLIVITVAAFLSFISVANAGILSASRYPLAMSRDHIIPTFFRKISSNGTPVNSLIITVLVIIVNLLVFDPIKIAKLASAFQLLIFALLSVAVIVMRESKITSYDPGYKSPFYPWTQIAGIVTSLFLILQMGALPVVFSLVLILLGIFWYWYYARKRTERSGAIYHIFERLGRQRFVGLDSELRGILKEKGLRKGDPFDEIVLRSKVFEFKDKMDFDEVVFQVSEWLEIILPLSKEQIRKQIMDGTRIGATPVTRGVALPHFRVDGIDHPEMVLVRSSAGIRTCIFNPLTQETEGEEIVNAIFFLISPEKDPTQHLRILAQIAGRVDDENFMNEWQLAKDEQELKESLLHDESFYSLLISNNTKSNVLIGKALHEVKLPENCLVALLRRENKIIVPKGRTVLEVGDRLTIIGDIKTISQLRIQFDQ
ncbi:MAG: amino acid permease [Melioribacteraceae bacterium]|nr:amino acid permease [Melioribacteraceae bacterium]